MSAPLIVSEEQQALGKTARELAEKHAPLTRLRELRDASDVDGYDRDLWTQLAELGFTALPFSEADGGFGLGLPEITAVMEGLGGTLSASPLLSLVVAGGLLADAGTEAQRSAWLPGLITGEVVVTLAWEERRTRGEPRRVAMTAQAGPSEGDDWSLTGEKRGVLDGGAADAFIVAAQLPDGLGLFLVDSGADGVDIAPLTRTDGRGASDVRFTGAAAERLAVAPGADSLAALERALDHGRVALAAEMLGAMTAVFQTTGDYLKTRVQFGKPLGAFQALQHRAVDCFVQIELARSTVMAAARAEPGDLPQLASLAKACAGEAFRLVADEAVQMHGGIGVTDECDVGFYLKRARVADSTLGDARYHRARWASLRGY